MKIIDLHCDTISALVGWENHALRKNDLHFDIDRALTAGLCLQFFAMFTMTSDPNAALREIMIQMDRLYLEIFSNEDAVFMVKRYQDLENITQQNRMGCILHLENAEALGTDVEVLRQLFRLGLRSIGLTWNHDNQLAGGIGGGPHPKGLTHTGQEIIREMNNLGIILDLSHISERAFFEAFEYYRLPVMVTHANARAICNHRRNLSDSQLKTLAANGGIIGLNQVADFVHAEEPTLDIFIDHIVYIGELIGIEHVALGSDFDGADRVVIPGVQGYTEIEKKLFRRGFTTSEIEMVLNRNALRVIKAVIKD